MRYGGRVPMRIRLLGIAISATILVAGFTFWRSTSAPDGADHADGGLASHSLAEGGQHRGGQIVTSGRAGPRTFNRLLGQDQLSSILGMLTLGRLVRVNFSTFDVEPWLAEKWDTSPDALTYTFHLRPGLTWSDAVPFTADDVVFSVQAIFDPKVHSYLADVLKVDGKPITAQAPDPSTVVIHFP